MATSFKVLILEDDPAIGEIQKAMLTSLGYLPVLARSGDQALQLCREHAAQEAPFPIALLDLSIEGGRGGRDILGALLEINDSLRAIACSGFCEEELNMQLLAEGFADILAKPFRPKELEEVLRRNEPMI